MGRNLGFFDNREELDRPDLNKCPDCQCYFSGDECPLCGKTCPEEMRAGNRPAVKHKKRSRSDSGRVTFIEWYHSWWFIVIMMFLFPIVGIVLLVTSPHEKWKKLVFAGVAAVYLVVSAFGIGNLFMMITNALDKPVDTSLSREEYIARCESVTPEQFYRSSEDYEDEFLKIRLKVVCKAEFVDSYYDGGDVYYVCQAEDASGFFVIVRDCLIDSSQNLIAGDMITLCGEGAEPITAFCGEKAYPAPVINMAYLVEVE
jgi:hypothetical protein